MRIGIKDGSQYIFYLAAHTGLWCEAVSTWLRMGYEPRWLNAAGEPDPRYMRYENDKFGDDWTPPDVKLPPPIVLVNDCDTLTAAAVALYVVRYNTAAMVCTVNDGNNGHAFGEVRDKLFDPNPIAGMGYPNPAMYVMPTKRRARIAMRDGRILIEVLP